MAFVPDAVCFCRSVDDWDDGELSELIKLAYIRFKAKAEEIKFHSDTRLIIKSDRFCFQLSLENGVKEMQFDVNLVEPFVKIELDNNLLHRLLRGPRYAHWNNAEIGSHLKFFRKPNIFEKNVYGSMVYFHC